MKFSLFSIFFLTILFAGTYNSALSCGNSDEACCCKQNSPKSKTLNNLLTEYVSTPVITVTFNSNINNINSGNNSGVCICNQDHSEPGNQRNAISLQMGKLLIARHISHLPKTSDNKNLSQSSIKIQHNSPPALIPLRI